MRCDVVDAVGVIVVGSALLKHKKIRRGHRRLEDPEPTIMAELHHSQDEITHETVLVRIFVQSRRWKSGRRLKEQLEGCWYGDS